MKTTEVSKDLIGRRCECIFTGMMVTGVIEDTEENEYSVNVKVRFDHPHQWGDDFYTEDWNVKVRFDHPHQWGDDFYTEDWAWGAQV